MKKIILHTDSLNERGTSVAVFDYAYFLREYLDMTPIITFNKKCDTNLPESIDRFQKEFLVIGYEDFETIHGIDADYFYAIKYGTKDALIKKNSKNLIHSVFVSDLNEVHGDSYAVVSEWMSSRSNYQIPYVPHMINLPEHNNHIRNEIGIPDSHVIIGRLGGFETFDIPFVNEVIQKVLEQRNDIWFFLMNTPNVIRHERCFYVNRNTDLSDKVTYINTCDAMLHARIDGETFGLSVLEFASKNKQIISCDHENIRNKNHFLYLKENCHRYKTEFDLEKTLLNITRENPFDTYYLKDIFSSKNVIEKFKTVFL